MKRYLLPAMLLLLTCTSGCASDKSDKSVDNLITEFSHVENAEYVNVNPFLMTLGKVAISFSDNETAKIADKVSSVKVLTLDNSPQADKQRLSKRIADLSSKGYDELIRVNDCGKQVRILARLDKDSTIRHLLVMSNDSGDCSLVSIRGKFSKDNIGEIINSATDKKYGGK